MEIENRDALVFIDANGAKKVGIYFLDVSSTRTVYDLNENSKFIPEGFYNPDFFESTPIMADYVGPNGEVTSYTDTDIPKQLSKAGKKYFSERID